MRGIFFFLLLPALLFSQEETPVPVKGSSAPSLSLTLQDNSTKTLTFPLQKRLVLLHIWSATTPTAMTTSQHMALRSIGERYRKSYYKTAEGFEVITLALHTDRKTWKEALLRDSLAAFTNGIPPQGQDETILKSYGISDLPHDLLIDETGQIVAVNPGMKQLEMLLMERKIFQPVKRCLTGTLAQALNREEVFKTGKICLLNSYGDSLARATTLGNGKFNFTEVNLHQDLVLRIPGQKDMDPMAPIALFSAEGDYLMNGRLENDECVFYIPYKMVPRLTDRNTASGPSEQLLVLHNLEFSKSDAFQLSPQDEKYLDALIAILVKIKSLNIEFKVHTDTKITDAAAMDLTTRQAQLIRSYLVNKGVGASRIKATPKGRSTPLKPCADPANCSDEELKQNRRVEFIIS